MFRLLVRHGRSGLSAGDIGQQMGIPQTTLSFHLSQLAHAGLVKARRDGRSIFYAVDYSRINALVTFLTEHCCEACEGSRS